MQYHCQLPMNTKILIHWQLALFSEAKFHVAIRFTQYVIVAIFQSNYFTRTETV